MDRVVLRPRASPQHNAPSFVEVSFLPSRGMSLQQAHARLFNNTTVDVVNSSLSFAGAMLLPFANRVRGRLDPDGKTIDTSVLGRRIRLPANWQGQRPGAERCAMHGLMFDKPVRVTEVRPDFVVAMFDAGGFNGHWPSRTLVHLVATLSSTCLELGVTVQNTGRDPLPIGIGWHPYFAIPSGERSQARLHIPAARRACVTNYDDVFPTGALVDVAGTPYDFRSPEGATLGTQYFDDMFVDLAKTSAGHTRIELHDPASGYHMRLTALSRHISAVQLYAPPDGAFAVIEPQFNWADPFSDVWPAGVNTGMVVVRPDEDITWAVRWELL
jgi:aldose 1-epimerase